MSEEVERRFQELEKLSRDYAQAQALADHLVEFRKSKKAMLMKAAETSGINVSATQEREAYRHAEYVELLEGLRAATEEALRLKWALNIAQMRFEMWRTKQANKRAEMNLR